MMKQMLGRASHAALDLLFPPQCALCRRAGSLLCGSCADDLPPADGRRCDCCWMPLASGRLCRHCAAAPPSFDALRSPFIMDAGARRLAHELKYEGMTALAGPMAQLILERTEAPAAQADRPADVVMPVPLHRARERARGYNQAAMLARSIAAGAHLPCDARAVRRTRNTEPLAKTMHREERLAIMRGAFAARPERVEGLRILLVDDVATTGATLDACGAALLAAGARSVRCLTWARAE
ncbi:MAG: ComF family protein [Chloroflexota bacterium]|nr:ComF family protein [Chloroflexota bacterium]